MITVDVRITNKQLEFLKRKAGRQSVTTELSKMVMSMLDGMIWMEEHEQEVKTNGESTTD